MENFPLPYIHIPSHWASSNSHQHSPSESLYVQDLFTNWRASMPESRPHSSPVERNYQACHSHTSNLVGNQQCRNYCSWYWGFWYWKDSTYILSEGTAVCRASFLRNCIQIRKQVIPDETCAQFKDDPYAGQGNFLKSLTMLRIDIEKRLYISQYSHFTHGSKDDVLTNTQVREWTWNRTGSAMKKGNRSGSLPPHELWFTIVF